MIVLVTVNDKNYQPLAELTVGKNKKQYCEKHGYELYHVNCTDHLTDKKFIAKNPPIPDEFYPMGWSKVFAMKQALEKYPNCNWIFNTDADVAITNMEVKIEEIIEKYGNKNTEIFIPADCNGINCGNMIIKNSPIGKSFLDTIIAGMPLYRHWYLFENQLIQDLCIGSHLEETGITPGGSFWGRVIKVLPQKVMNSYDYSDLPRLKNRPNYNDILGNNGQWEQGDFLIQWPSTDLEYRISKAKKICT